MGDPRVITDRFTHLYRNVPAARPGVCRICHSGPSDCYTTGEPYPICLSCRRTTAGLYRHTDYVVPISLCVKEEDQLYDIVSRYRDPSPQSSVDRTIFLAATVARFYQVHRSCLARLAGGGFTLVATVPSMRLERQAQESAPMARVVEMVTALQELHKTILMPVYGRAPFLAARESDDRAFQTTCRIDGERVLLLDDLFVSGAHVQSAASALYRAGAAAVVALVIVRLVDPGSNGNARRIWEQAAVEPFSFERCCACDLAAGPFAQPA